MKTLVVRNVRFDPLELLQFHVESAQPKDGQMKARFTDEQIIQMIKEHEAGERTADVCMPMALTRSSTDRVETP